MSFDSHTFESDTRRLKAKTKEKGKTSTPGLRKSSFDSSKAALGPAVISGVDGTSTGVKETGSEWPWMTLADSFVCSRPPAFTNDGNYFFSVVGSAVRIYSVATRKVVSTLSSSSIGSSASRVANGEGHSDVITSAIVNPEDPFQLLTASLDGDIKIWNFLDAMLVRTIRIGYPISHMCAHKQLKGQVFIAVLTKQRKIASSPLDKGNTLIYRVSLIPKHSASAEPSKSAEVVRIGKTKAAISMGVSQSGAWLVVIAGQKAYVSRTSSSEFGFTKFVSPEKLTCLAFHPSEDYFATGDEIGQIRIWYCLDGQLASGTTGEKRAQTTTMHWHAHAVSSLTFTRNGAYLLSGGEESVLVIWQLQTGKKEFVPRLGSPIMTITIRPGTEDEEYLLGLADGTYLFVRSSSLNVIRSVARVRLDPKGSGRQPHTPVPLAAHRRTSTLILPASHPSSLQLYSPSTSALSELEISPSNRVSRRDEKEIEAARVDFVTVSSSGDWMATMDARDNDEEFSAEVNLKFWQWDESGWALNTRIDRPHGFKRIVAMDFLPKTLEEEGELLMTVGLDGNVKTWCIRSVTAKGGRAEVIWINRSILNYRAELPTDACWSPDGSLLAVSFGRQIALYSPYSNLLLDYLTTMDIRTIDTIRFMGKSGRYLLATGRNNVVLWDLVTRTICWHFYTPFTIAQTLAHPDEELAALVTQPFVEDAALRTSEIMHFTPSSSKPISIRTLPFRFRVVDWFGLDGGNRSLIGITYSWSIVVCGDDLPSFSEIGEAPQVLDRISEMPHKKTLFQDIFGKSAFLDTANHPSHTATGSAVSHPSAEKRQDTSSLFDVPAYLAPPLETLYSSLLTTFLNKSRERAEPKVEIERDEVEDMVVDNEPLQTLPDNRLVDQAEVDDLVNLFRKHPVDKGPGQVAHPNGVVNGTHKTHEVRANGTLLNAMHSHVSTPKATRLSGMDLKLSRNIKANNSSPAASATESVAAGNKRKKSIS